MAHPTNFAKLMEKFILNPALNGSYAEAIWRGFQLVEVHDKLLHNDNQLLLRLKIQPNFCNYQGTIHGGALCTILDCATTLAILKVDKHHRKNVSAELNYSFLSPATVNDNLLILSECYKVGKTMAFTKADLYIEDGLKLIGTGRHLKAMLAQKFDE